MPMISIFLISQVKNVLRVLPGGIKSLSGVSIKPNYNHIKMHPDTSIAMNFLIIKIMSMLKLLIREMVTTNEKKCYRLIGHNFLSIKLLRSYLKDLKHLKVLKRDLIKINRDVHSSLDSSLEQPSKS